MDYLSRMIEYSDLLHELEISGDNHLRVILKNPSSYLNSAEEAQARISSDKFLSSEDRERMLKEINGYVDKVEENIEKTGNKKDDGLGTLALLAIAVLYMLKSDEGGFTSDALVAFKDELEKILGK